MHRHRVAALLGGALVLAGCATGVPAPVRDASAPDQPVDAPVTTRVAYGDHADQWVDLTVPAGEGPFPVVVLLHGGFWLEQYEADLMEPLAADVVARGWAAANVEYRRVGGAGGWPMTFEDVAAAIDALASVEAAVDLDRVVLVGHSAGGHLALWGAGRDRLPPDAPGADPVVRPCAVVSQAGVADLAESALLDLGGGAARSLMGGGPETVGERYDVGDPARLLPLGVPVLVVHGTGDRIVPPSLSASFVDAAEAAGDEVTHLPVDGDHFVVLDPGDTAWTQTVDWMTRTC